MAIVIAVAGAGDIVTGGLRHILGQAPDFEILEESTGFGVVPDVVLYDVVAMQRDDGARLGHLLDRPESVVVVVNRELRPDLAARAMTLGAAGWICIEDPASEILATIRAVASGLPDPGGRRAASLGDDAGLSRREVEVLGDIVKGLSNREIGELRALTHNTVKTYIRHTYQKIGVRTRAQAVSWGLQHGFDPHRTTSNASPRSERGRPVVGS